MNLLSYDAKCQILLKIYIYMTIITDYSLVYPSLYSKNKFLVFFWKVAKTLFIFITVKNFNKVQIIKLNNIYIYRNIFLMGFILNKKTMLLQLFTKQLFSFCFKIML